MRTEELGSGIEEGDAIATEIGEQNPQSKIPNPEMERRLLWRCRRGLLELDIVLGRFVRQRYPLLNDEQRMVFDELLDLPDTELWDLITGNRDPMHARHGGVLEWMKEA
jgi:antitoxin CptB